MNKKVCCRCQQEKTLDQFFRDRRAKDGTQSWCKRCKKGYETTSRGKRAREKARTNYLKKNKGKERARKIAQKKICLEGCLCHFCSEEADHRHHLDYDSPLSIIPVCIRCHADVHYGGFW